MTQRSPLGELYDSVKRATGWASRDFERRAKAAGVPISKSRILQIVNAWPLEGVTTDAIDGIAAALGVSRDRVALAAVQSMGYRISGDSVTPAEAIMRDENLSPDTREALLSIIRTAERRRGA